MGFFVFSLEGDSLGNLDRDGSRRGGSTKYQELLASSGFAFCLLGLVLFVFVLFGLRLWGLGFGEGG